MLTPQQIREVESAVNAYKEQIHGTFLKRSESREAWERWRQACDKWHSSCQPTDYLWENSTREKLLSGDQEVIEDAILFLEVDPWFFRSGYLKERVIVGLKRAELTTLQRRRLQQVILKVCFGRNRREFRRYCALAAVLWTQEFEDSLRSEAAAHDFESNRKLSYLLKYLEQNRKPGG